jgi:hypothetical protein
VLKNSAGSTVWDVDPFPAAFSSAEDIGTLLWPPTAAEIAASVTPTYYSYPPGDLRRYGGVGDDSTNNAAPLTSAIAQAAQSTGAKVYVPQGTFRQTTAVAVLAGVTIEGEGEGSILKQTTADTVNLSLAVAGVTIRGIHFQGGIGSTTTARVLLNAASKIAVESCFFSALSGWGVHSQGASSEVRVSGCKFYGWTAPTNGASGVNVYNEGERFTITENTVLGGSTSNTTGAFFGISVLRSDGAGTFHQFAIANNHVIGLREYGILVYGNTETTEGVTITGNTIAYVYSSTANAASGAGIYLLRPGKTTVSGNSIGYTNLSTSEYGLCPGAIGVNAAYRSLTISGNTIYNTTENGISIKSGLSDSSVAIVGNTFDTTAKASIVLSGQNRATVTGNTVRSASNALYVDLFDGLAVSGNFFDCTATTAVTAQVLTGTQATISGNTIINAATDFAALAVSDVTACRVSGNLLVSAGDDAYETAGTCTGTLADESNGLSRAFNNGTGTNVVLRVTAAPSAGTYKVGDRAWDTDAASGAPMGWVCTVAGSPGTWTAMPNLA